MFLLLKYNNLFFILSEFIFKKFRVGSGLGSKFGKISGRRVGSGLAFCRVGSGRVYPKNGFGSGRVGSRFLGLGSGRV